MTNYVLAGRIYTVGNLARLKSSALPILLLHVYDNIITNFIQSGNGNVANHKLFFLAGESKNKNKKINQFKSR